MADIPGTKTSSRQLVHRDFLDQLDNRTSFADTAGNKPSNSLKLNDLFKELNTQLKLPFEMQESVTPNLSLNIGPGEVTTNRSDKNRTFAQIDGQHFTFTSGIITFPAASGGAVTVTPGADTVLNLTTGNYIKALVQINGTGQLSIVFGTENTTEATATMPATEPGKTAIGYVVLQNVGGVIQNIVNANIHQFTDLKENQDGLTVQETDSNPSVTGVKVIKFANGTVTDEGSGTVSINTNPNNRLADDDGCAIVNLTPLLKCLVLEAPDSTRYEYSVDNNGVIIATTTTNAVNNYRIKRTDGVEVSFAAANGGALQAVTPADSGAQPSERFYFKAPEGTMWRVVVTPSISPLILQSPDSTKWSVSVNDAGDLVSTSGATAELTNYKIKRTDGTFVSFAITNDGNFQVVEPADGGALEQSQILLPAPGGGVWDLTINNSNDTVTQSTTATNLNVISMNTDVTVNNKLSVRNDKDNVLFQIQEFEEGSGVFQYHRTINATQLAAITPPTAIAGTVPTAWYDTGSGIRQIFYDGGWKYVHDNSSV